MKTFLIILSCLIGAVLILLFVLGVLSREGKPPGLFEGHLSKCPDKPNCVCSEFSEDASHHIEPIAVPDAAAGTFTLLKTVILDMGGVIHTDREDYLAATFSSPVFGFTDDLEIRNDTGRGVIHIRSASRVGHGDMGVNRRRVEQLKGLFQERMANPDLPVPPPTG